MQGWVGYPDYSGYSLWSAHPRLGKMLVSRNEVDSDVSYQGRGYREVLVVKDWVGQDVRCQRLPVDKYWWPYTKQVEVNKIILFMLT